MQLREIMTPGVVTASADANVLAVARSQVADTHAAGHGEVLHMAWTVTADVFGGQHVDDCQRLAFDFE